MEDKFEKAVDKAEEISDNVKEDFNSLGPKGRLIFVVGVTIIVVFGIVGVISGWFS